jgi:glycosyltransferase involved in cell wall biosynthesis
MKEEGIKTIIVNTHGSLPKRIHSVLNAFVKSYRSDVILGVGCAYLGFFPITIAALTHWITRTPVVYDFHDGQAGIFLDRYHRLIKFFIRNKPVVCASWFVYEEFKSYGLNAVRIPYHFHFEKTFYKRKSEFTWNKKILWARAFLDLYQPEIALQAAIMVLERIPDAEFHFYGDGYMRESLMKKFKTEGIVFHGFVNRSDFLKEYENYSLLINTTAFDNFPLSIVEAGYNEMCVLSTNVGGISTIYNSNEVVFYMNPEELAQKIIDVITEPKKYDSYRYNLRKKVLTFRWECVREQWLKLLTL